MRSSGAVPEDNGAHPLCLGVVDHYLLGKQLALTVRRCGLLRCLLGDRHPLGVAIGGARARVDEVGDVAALHGLKGWGWGWGCGGVGVGVRVGLGLGFGLALAVGMALLRCMA